MKQRRLPAVYCLVACALLPAAGHSETAPGDARALLKAEAERYVQAYARGDNATCLAVMGGDLIQSLGGKIAVLDQYRRTAQALQKHQLTLASMVVGDPGGIIPHGSNHVFCVIPERHAYAGPEGAYILNSYLLAVSEDRGLTWNLLEGSARVSDFIRNNDRVLFAKLKLPVRTIALADDPKMYLVEKGGGFVTSPETLKYKKSFRKIRP